MLFSREMLQSLIDVDLSNETFPFRSARIINVAGHTVRALRTSFVGELGWELHIPTQSCLAVYNALWETGVKYGLRQAGYRALYSLSSEKGDTFWLFWLEENLFAVLCFLMHGAKIMKKKKPFGLLQKQF